MNTSPSLGELAKIEASQIDAYYDSLLVDGMPADQVRWVEEQRNAAHADLKRRALAVVLNGYR